jgi:hypothetical protein
MFFTRRHLLYAMLAALALAGIAGALALLTASGNEVWRIAGTSFVVAIAAGIMMPMSVWADKPATRAAGLFGMCIAIVELLLAAVLIWGSMLPSSFRDFVAWSTGIVGPCGLLSARFLKELAHPSRRWMAIVGAAGAALAATSWLIASWLDSFNSSWTVSEPFFYSGWAILFAGILAALALVGITKSDGQWWRWFGVAGAIIGAAVAVYGAIERKGGNPGWIAGPYSLAAVIAHAIVVLRIPLTPGQRWVRWVAMIAALCTGITTTHCVATEARLNQMMDDFDWSWRLSSAFALVCASASMALLVLGRLNRKPVVELSKAEVYGHVSLDCPRCEKKLRIPMGGALCDSCRLYINVTVKTAKCAKCNYDLTNLTTEFCPECGTPIPRGQTKVEAAS